MSWSAIGNAIGGMAKTAGSAITKGASWVKNNGDTINKVLGGIGSLGGLGSLFNSGSSSSEAAAQQYQYNLALQKQAQDWNEYMYKHRYQFQVDDLEAAGINKLYGLGNAPSVTSGASSVGMPDKVGEENNKRARLLEAFNLAREYSATKTQNKKVEAETLTEFYNAQVQKLEAIRKAKENKYYDRKTKAEINNAEANTIEVLANADKIISEKMGIDRINKWHKDHPFSSDIATGSKEFNGMVNTGLSGYMTMGEGYSSLDKSYQKLKKEYDKIYDTAKYNRKYYYRKYMY